MSTDSKLKILLVDDEAGILKALKRILSDLDVDILTASCGAEALKILDDNKIALIISDQKMPEMTGIELLERFHDLSPYTIRILLTGYADIKTTVDAINSGAVRYYLSKPWDEPLLISRIKDSIEIYKSGGENRRLLELTKAQNEKLSEFNQNLQEKVDEQTSEIKKQHGELKKSFMETIKSFSTIVGLRHRSVASHSQRVATLVKLLLDGMELDEKEYQDIIVASYLHDIGKIGLPESIATKDTGAFSNREREIFQKHPILGQSCICSITGFEQISEIIRHHHENFDGTGYPDCLIGEKIPFGSRVLRICDAFDQISNHTEYPDLKTLSNATAILQRYAGSQYDPSLVSRFLDKGVANQFYHDDSHGVIGLKPSDLKENMVIAMDIKTMNEVFLLPKGAKLSNGMIKRIQKLHAVDPIIEAIRIYSRSVTKEKQHVSA